MQTNTTIMDALNAYTDAQMGKQPQIEITSTHKKEHPKGNSKKVFFTYDGVKYVWTYNYANSYGFIFIIFEYSSEHIYSSTQPELNTELGVKLELAISKMKIDF